MRIKLLALVALVATATAAYFLLRPVVLPEDQEPEPCVGDACGPQGPSAEQRLAERYAPVADVTHARAQREAATPLRLARGGVVDVGTGPTAPAPFRSLRAIALKQGVAISPPR